MTTAAKKEAADPYRGREPREIPAYAMLEAARYLRTPERTLFDWAFGYTSGSKSDRRHLPPLIRVANAEHHLLSFTNLAELHVLDALRRVHHLRMRKVRQTILYLGREFCTVHPLVHKEMWTDGASVFVDHYGQLINASQRGPAGHAAAGQRAPSADRT